MPFLFLLFPFHPAQLPVLGWAPGMGLRHTRSPGSQDSALSHCQPCHPHHSHLRMGVQMTLTYLVNIFLGRAFLMVVGFSIGIIDPPHVRITEKNLKHKDTFTRHQHLLTYAETERLLGASGYSHRLTHMGALW